MKGVTEQVVVVVVERSEEGGDKEKKKRRRPRRPKHNPPSPQVDGTYVEATKSSDHASSSNHASLRSQNCELDNHASNDQGFSKASGVGFSSLPTMHINGDAIALPSVQDQYQSPPTSQGKVVNRSCPEPISRETNGSFQNNINFIFPKNERYADAQRKYFFPHWSAENVDEAIQKGDAFRASFRVNAHNRLEAYCTVEGIPTDVLISGVAQNRAVEGDVVAIQLDPLESWTRLKGSGSPSNNSVPLEDSDILPEVVEVVGDDCKGKGKLNGECESNKRLSSFSERVDYVDETEGQSSSIKKICAVLTSFPSKRPTGTVVAIIEKSPRRDAVVGFLSVKQWLSYREGCRKETGKNKNPVSTPNQEYIQLKPNDAKFQKMMVPVEGLPDDVKVRLMGGETLVAARIVDWREEDLLPRAHVLHVFGRGGEIDSQMAAILFENGICKTEFSPQSLSSLPDRSWEVPVKEFERRKDLRNLCTFTIDPPTATDLDDALSMERISDGILRVGVHVADVSYFVLPDTPLDKEVQTRSTSVYLNQHKLPMLPSLLSENFGSLIPGVDRLCFSIMFDCNIAGEVIDRWIGRTVIRSCCKLSYQQAQVIIDGSMDFENHSFSVSEVPEMFGNFEWQDVVESVKNLYDISKKLKEKRINDGAVHLNSSKIFFLFDECGIPYDSVLYGQTDSNSLIEEFMLLANRTAAEVITRAFPDCALLRRHPEPNARRLRDFEVFWQKHGLELDTSSSSQLHLSLGKIREKLKSDPVLFDILISYASKPMQLATYFCTGDLKDREQWGHYALAIPLYTHFTSPLRRYPDIVVHRTLAAAIEAENMYLHQQTMLRNANNREAVKVNIFSSLNFNKEIVETKEFKEALCNASLKHSVPCTKTLGEVATYCNKRGIASRHAEDASEKFYLWILLKKKETLITEARVLGLGPKFMSIYIHKFGIERRIYYDEVDGLTAEWLETTSTLVLNLSTNRRTHRRNSPGRYRSLEDVACVINPCDLNPKEVLFGNSENSENEIVKVQQAVDDAVLENPSPVNSNGISENTEIDPAVFPLTVRPFSTIHVALYAVGGDDGPLDVGARLYMCSYFN